MTPGQIIIARNLRSQAPSRLVAFRQKQSSVVAKNQLLLWCLPPISDCKSVFPVITKTKE